MGWSCVQSVFPFILVSGNMISPKSSLPEYLVVSFWIAATAITHLVCITPARGGWFIEQLRSSTIIRFEWQSAAATGPARAATRHEAMRNLMGDMITSAHRGVGAGDKLWERRG